MRPGGRDRQRWRVRDGQTINQATERASKTEQRQRPQGQTDRQTAGEAIKAGWWETAGERDGDSQQRQRWRENKEMERWCKQQRSEEPQQDRGRERQTDRERGDKPEIQTEEETGRQSANCFFSRGPAGEFWEGLGTSQWCPSGAEGVEFDIGKARKCVWVPRPGSGRRWG